ncbi:hypothetical protein J6590_010632 [Homalodisca vitripennis]|nr:hypothetical protein J6590_010632 [Homalodisca vitripennis]
MQKLSKCGPGQTLTPITRNKDVCSATRDVLHDRTCVCQIRGLRRRKFTYSPITAEGITWQMSERLIKMFYITYSFQSRSVDAEARDLGLLDSAAPPRPLTRFLCTKPVPVYRTSSLAPLSMSAIAKSRQGNHRCSVYGTASLISWGAISRKQCGKLDRRVLLLIY